MVKRSFRLWLWMGAFLPGLDWQHVTALSTLSLKKKPCPFRHHPRTRTAPPTRLGALLPPDDFPWNAGRSYGERSRPYRRDVFDYERWVKHRAAELFIFNLSDVMNSGIVRQLQKEATMLGLTSTLICAFNTLLVEGFDDLRMVHHEPLWPHHHLPLLALPSLMFDICSPSLALLLIFKTDTSYARWDEGRKAWGDVVSSSRTIVREAATWCRPRPGSGSAPKEEATLHQGLARLSAALYAFSRSLTRDLLSASEDEEAYQRDLFDRLDAEWAQDLVSARHRSSRALYDLTCAVLALPWPSAYAQVHLDQALQKLGDALGTTERIFSSPVPRKYTLHTTQSLALYLLFMPLMLYQPLAFSWNHVLMIPITVLIGFLLLGIEELSVQLEEPFSVLPMHVLTQQIAQDAEDHLAWFSDHTSESEESSELGSAWAFSGYNMTRNGTISFM